MFGLAFHPNSPKHNTLGWARLDISLETNEVLIEEVQNDWLRDVKYYQRQLKLADKQDQKYWLHDYEAWWSKYTEVVWVYMKMWDELILSATLWFIRDELGIENVWYHSFDSSNYYKQVSRYSQPPQFSCGRKGLFVRPFFIIRYYIFRLYCPPTSNKASVICPSEQTLQASIKASNMLPFRNATS